MANVSINSLVVHDWHYTGTAFTLRVFSDRSFVALDGSVVPGRGDANTFYREYTITVVGTDATIPVVTLASQTDAPNEKNARYMAYFYVDGVERDMFLASTLGAFQVPDTPATTTWANLEQYNFGVSRRYYKDDNTYSALVIDQKIAAASIAGTVNATASQKGISRLSVAAVTPTDPIVAGDNDPRLTAIRRTLPYLFDGSVIVGKFVRMNGVNVEAIPADDSGGGIGIVTSGASGSAIVQLGGAYSGAVLDGTAAVGDYLQSSTSIPGAGHSVGATYPIGGQVLGRVIGLSPTVVDIFGTEVRAGNDIPAFTLYTSKYASLNTAITAITTLGGGTIIVDAPTPVTSSVATTALIGLRFQGQGQLTGSGKTVTINGPIDGPPVQLWQSGIIVVFTSNTKVVEFLGEWWGFSTSSDGGALLNTILAAVPDDVTITLPTATVNQATMVDINGRERVLFQGTPSYRASKTVLRWNGAVGGSASRIFNSIFSGFRYVRFDGTGGIDRGVIMDGDGTHTSSQDILDNVCVLGPVPKRATFKGITVDESNYANNNDIMIFNSVYVQGSTTTGDANAGTGFYNGNSSNAHGHTFSGTSVFFGCNIGMHFVSGSINTSGSIDGSVISFQGNNTDIRIDDLEYGSKLQYVDTEGSNQFAIINSTSNAPLEIANCRLASFGKALTPFILFGSTSQQVFIHDNLIVGVNASVIYDAQSLASSSLSLRIEGNRYQPGLTIPILITNSGSILKLSIRNDAAAPDQPILGSAQSVYYVDQLQSVGVGVALSISANTIIVSKPIHHLGAGLLKTINGPPDTTRFITGCVKIIPDAAFTTDVTGNIGKASTAVIGVMMEFCYDGSHWWPSY